MSILEPKHVNVLSDSLHGYQYTIRVEEGWNDLPQRAAQLRQRAEDTWQTHQEIKNIREALGTDDGWTRGISMLTYQLSMMPNNDMLLRFCVQQARSWLVPNNMFPERAQEVVRQGILWGQGSRVNELHQLQHVIRLVVGTRALIFADRMVDAANLALRVASLPDHDQIGQEALQSLLETALMQVIHRQQWESFEVMWLRVEQLFHSPKIMEDLFPRAWGEALAESIRAEQWQVVHRLWQRVAERCSVDHHIWHTPRNLIARQIEAYLVITKRRSLADKPDDYAQTQHKLTIAEGLLPPEPTVYAQAWQGHITEQLRRTRQTLYKAEELVTEYRRASTDGDWASAVDRLDELQQLNLNWYPTAGQKTLTELLKEARTEYIEQMLQKIEQANINACQAVDFASAYQSYSEVKKLYAQAYAVAELVASTTVQKQLQVKLQRAHTVVTEVTQEYNQLEKARELFAGLGDSQDKLEYLRTLDMVRQLCRQIHPQWHHLGVKALLDDIEQEYAAEVEKVCRGLLDYCAFVAVNRKSWLLWQLLPQAEELAAKAPHAKSELQEIIQSLRKSNHR